MKFTPHGERIGDKIRKQLANPKSRLSKVTKRWNTWKYVAKNHPDKYEIRWDLFSFDLFLVGDYFSTQNGELETLIDFI